MNPADIEGRTAWAAAALLLVQMLLGLSLRRGMNSNRADSRDGVRLFIHAGLGLVLLPVTFVHAWWSMSSGSIRSANVAGLWIATAAIALLAIQLVLGATLIRRSDRKKQLARRTHFVLAIVLLCLAGVHVVLNRSAIKSKERIKYENAVLSINNLSRQSGSPGG
jgi:hypothetical protein